MGLFSRLFSGEKGQPAPQEAQQEKAKQEAEAKGQENAEISSRDLGKQRVDQLVAGVGKLFGGFKDKMKSLGGWLADQAFTAVGYTEKEWDRTDFKKRAEQAKKGAKVAGAVAAAPVVLAAGVAAGAGKAGWEAGKAGYKAAEKGVKAGAEWTSKQKAELKEAAEKSWKEIKQEFRQIVIEARAAKVSFDRSVRQAKERMQNWKNEQLIKLMFSAELQGEAKAALQQVRDRARSHHENIVEISNNPIEPVVEVEMGDEEDELTDAWVEGALSGRELGDRLETRADEPEVTVEDEEEDEEPTVRYRNELAN